MPTTGVPFKPYSGLSGTFLMGVKAPQLSP
jgi:hypothetical protein